MARLDKEKQLNLEPKRINFAKSKILELGFKIVFEDKTRVDFIFKNEIVHFYPYSGWHTGKSITDGRGINNLLKQLKHE
jgi:hypothetical protein